MEDDFLRIIAEPIGLHRLLSWNDDDDDDDDDT